MHDDITDIPGIRVGHYTNLEAATGCTVILCDTPAVGGVDVRGGAPATRETDLLLHITWLRRSTLSCLQEEALMALIQPAA